MHAHIYPRSIDTMRPVSHSIQDRYIFIGLEGTNNKSFDHNSLQNQIKAAVIFRLMQTGNSTDTSMYLQPTKYNIAILHSVRLKTHILLYKWVRVNGEKGCFSIKHPLCVCLEVYVLWLLQNNCSLLCIYSNLIGL